LKAAGAVAEEQIAKRPARSTQEFAETYRHFSLGTPWFPDGSPIWPEMWSIEALLERKKQLDQQDLLAWPQEYLNEPRPSETQMFYPERWPTDANVPYGLTILQFWKLAISEKTTADYTCGWTIGVDDQNNVLLLERRKGHWDFNRTLSEIQAMGQAWSQPGASGVLAMIGIEQVSYQAAAVQEALRRTMLPIVPVVPDKDKVTRARLLEARAAANKVVRPANVPEWWMDFAAEATYFPAGAHDDQIDALSGAVRLAGWQADSINWQYGVWKLFELRAHVHVAGRSAVSEVLDEGTGRLREPGAAGLRRVRHGRGDHPGPAVTLANSCNTST